MCILLWDHPPRALTHNRCVVFHGSCSTRRPLPRHYAPLAPHVSVYSRLYASRRRHHVLDNFSRDQILPSIRLKLRTSSPGLIQRQPQKPQQQTGQEENRRGRSGGWWGGRGGGEGGGSADKLTNKAILSQNRVSPPRKIRFFGGGFRIVLSEVPPPGHGSPAHSSPTPPTVRTRRRLKKSNRTEL